MRNLIAAASALLFFGCSSTPSESTESGSAEKGDIRIRGNRETLDRVERLRREREQDRGSRATAYWTSGELRALAYAAGVTGRPAKFLRELVRWEDQKERFITLHLECRRRTSAARERLSTISGAIAEDRLRRGDCEVFQGENVPPGATSKRHPDEVVSVTSKNDEAGRVMWTKIVRIAPSESSALDVATRVYRNALADEKAAYIAFFCAL